MQDETMCLSAHFYYCSSGTKPGEPILHISMFGEFQVLDPAFCTVTVTHKGVMRKPGRSASRWLTCLAFQCSNPDLHASTS